MAQVRRIRCAVTGRKWKETDRRGWWLVRGGGKEKLFWCCEPFTGQVLLRGWQVVYGIGAATALLAKWATEKESESAR